MVPRLDFLDLKRQDPAALRALKAAAKEVGVFDRLQYGDLPARCSAAA